MDRSAFHFENESLISKVGRITASASIVDAMMNDCPAKTIFNKYLADKVMPPQPDSPLVRGTTFHRALELYYGLDDDRVRQPDVNQDIMYAAMRRALKEEPEVKDNEEFRQWLKNAIDRYMQMGREVTDANIYRYVDRHNYDSLGLEMPVSGTIGNAKRRTFGKIDRLINDPNNPGAVIIDDYKSGKKAEAYNPIRTKENRYPESHFGYVRQQIIYAMLLEQGGRDFPKIENISSGRLIYPVAQNETSSKVGVVLDVDVNNAKWRTKTVRDVETASDMLNDAVNNNMWDCNPSPLCSWCPLVNICPNANRDEREKFVKARASQPTREKLGEFIKLS